jgi:hypothetical protein
LFALEEVVCVLEPDEGREFDALVSRLRADDPALTTKLEHLPTRRSRRRTTFSILLWILAPICVFTGGWTGFFMGVVAACYALHFSSRKPSIPGLTRPSPSAPQRPTI